MRFKNNKPASRQVVRPLLSVLTWTLIFASPAVAAHPYHVSLTEIAWNAESGNFEVALCVWPADLELALKQQAGRAVDLDTDPELEQLLEAYVRSCFAVVQRQDGNEKIPAAERARLTSAIAAVMPAVGLSAESSSGQIAWAGQEIDGKAAWLYFEVTGLDDPAKCIIENRAMFELNNDQMNHINFTGERMLSTVVCTPDSRRHGLTENATIGRN